MGRRALALATVASMIWSAACRDEGGGGGGDGEPVDLGTPATIAPTEPGALALRPSALLLAPGEQAALEVRLLDSIGGELPPPASLVFSAEPAGVVSVDSAGLVMAEAAGLAEVTVTDGSHGFAAIAVSVTPDGGAGVPIGVSFDEPVVVLEVDQSRAIAFAVTDGRGDEVPGGDALVTLEAGWAVTLDGFVATGFYEGVASVTASLAETGEPLPGHALVLVVAPGSAVEAWRSDSVGADCTDWLVSGCRGNMPHTFTRPGLSGDARVEVFRQRQCGHRIEFEWQQQSPDQLFAGAAGVIGLDGSGRVNALAPGDVAVQSLVEGVQCECEDVDVLLDMNGSWSATCDDGATGGMTLSGWPTWVYTAHSMLNGAPIGGTSCFSGGGRDCTGSARAFWGSIAPFPIGYGASPICEDRLDSIGMAAENHRCTSETPCYATAISPCAVVDPYSQLQITGPDSFRFDGCEWTRGESACAPAALCRQDYYPALGGMACECSPAVGNPEDHPSYVHPSCANAGPFLCCQLWGDGVTWEDCDCSNDPSCLGGGSQVPCCPPQPGETFEEVFPDSCVSG